MKIKNKIFKITIISLTLVLFGIGCSGEERQKSSISEEDVKFYEKKISKVKDFNPNQYRGNISKLEKEVEWFDEEDLTFFAPTNENEASKNYRKKFKSKLKNLQESEFPKIREEFKDILNDNLNGDVEVSLKGDRNEVLIFTSIKFSLDENIIQVNNILEDRLRKFRFKEVEYRASENNENYKSFSLETPQDSKLGEIDESDKSIFVDVEDSPSNGDFISKIKQALK